MSAKIVKSTFENKLDTLRVTTRDDAIRMKEIESGLIIKYKGHVIQDIVNEETGEMFQSILVLAEDGNVYATRSEFFIRKLEEIIEYLKDEGMDTFDLRITRQKSRNNNDFISCSLA